MERKRTLMAAEPLLQRAKPATLIAIDDGHGAETPGKRSPAFPDGSVLKENQFNSRTAELLAEALMRCGFATLMVAPEESDTPLKTRVMRANEARADAYISIHANAYGSGWNAANGVETWIYEKIMGQSNTYLFAQSVHEAFAAASGRKDRGLKRSCGFICAESYGYARGHCGMRVYDEPRGGGTSEKRGLPPEMRGGHMQGRMRVLQDGIHIAREAGVGRCRAANNGKAVIQVPDFTGDSCMGTGFDCGDGGK